MGRTDRLVSVMRNKEVFNRLILMLIVIIVGIADLALVYVKIERIFSVFRKHWD